MSFNHASDLLGGSSHFDWHFMPSSDKSSSWLGPVLGTKVHDAFRNHPIPLTAAILVFLMFLKPWITALLVPTPLNKIPGPWYAPYTTLHLRYYFARGTIWKYVEQKHDVYGDVIRLGPRQVWVADRSAMKEILLTTDLPKVAKLAGR